MVEDRVGKLMDGLCATINLRFMAPSEFRFGYSLNVNLEIDTIKTTLQISDRRPAISSSTITSRKLSN